MLPGMELMGCADLAVPAEVMRHVVRVESSFNPYAIGVVGGRLARQPRSLSEAVSTARMLERRGYNFSLGLAQVNRYNLAHQGLVTYERAFDACPNLQAGSRILADCYRRSGHDWGKALSCYYSGNFVTGYRHGYVQKVLASWQGGAAGLPADVVRLIDRRAANTTAGAAAHDPSSIVTRRIVGAVAGPTGVPGPVPSQPSVPSTSAARAGALSPATATSTGVGGAALIRNEAVVLQPMNADRSHEAPGEPPPDLTQQQASPRRDDAFVF